MRVNNAKTTSRSGNPSAKVAKRTVLIALLWASTSPISSVANSGDPASQSAATRSTPSRFHYAPAAPPVVSGGSRSQFDSPVGSVQSNPFVAATQRHRSHATVQLASGDDESIDPQHSADQQRSLVPAGQGLVGRDGGSKVQANPFVSRSVHAPATSRSGLAPLAADAANAFDRFPNPTPAGSDADGRVEPIAGYPTDRSQVVPVTDARDKRITVQETQPIFLSLSDDAVATPQTKALTADQDLQSTPESDDQLASDSDTDQAPSPLVELATPVHLAPVISLPKQIPSPPNDSAIRPGKIQDNGRINVATQDVSELKSVKASRRSNLIQVPRPDESPVEMSFSSGTGAASVTNPTVTAAEPLQIEPAAVPTLAKAKAKRHHVAVVPPPLPIAASNAENDGPEPPVGSVPFDPARSVAEDPEEVNAESEIGSAGQSSGPATSDVANASKVAVAKKSAVPIPVPPTVEPPAPKSPAKSRPVVAEMPNLPVVARNEISEEQAVTALVEVPASADPSRVRIATPAKQDADLRLSQDSVLKTNAARSQPRFGGSTQLASSKSISGGMPPLPEPPDLETESSVTGMPQSAEPDDTSTREKVVLQLSRAQVRSMTIGGRLRRVSIANKDVCQAFASGPNQIKLIGTGLGSTTLTLWADVAVGEPTRVQTFQVDVADGVNAKGDKVAAHTELLNDSIDKAFPRAAVVVSRNGAELVVTGHCDDESTAKQILRMVRKSCLVPVKDQLKVRDR